jgi:hypothetical protein
VAESRQAPQKYVCPRGHISYGGWGETGERPVTVGFQFGSLRTDILCPVCVKEFFEARFGSLKEA